MDNTKGLVSFLIPCYNHEKFAMDLFRSILNQSYDNYEVLVCDDCSKDNSVQVLKQAKELFEAENIRFELMINEANQGIVKNLNRMLKLAQGEFVKVIASDDVLETDYLVKMVELLDTNPQAKMGFCNCIKFDEAGHYPIQEPHIIGKLLEPFPDKGTYSFESIFKLNMVPAPSTIYRKAVLDEVGGYDEDIAIEDLEMLLRVLSRYPEGCAYTEEALVYYRINSTSISSARRNKGAHRRIRFMYDNQLKTARKYRDSVPKDVYRSRLHDIRLSYYVQLFHLIFG